ncbi:MAG TPA: PilZ domain-containing protein [Myxococcaceae bacterium]|nr:PilZ domain-containing protein [Myxococcaceae bacterium]
MSDSNKRKYPRVEGKGVAAYLRLNGHNAGCTVQNISVGGIFVRTDRFLPVGTKLAFDLVKPGMKKALTVSGWVVGVITAELSARTKLPQGLRIQFGKLTSAANEALQELVGSLRRGGDAQPPVLYPLEQKPARKAGATAGSGVKRPPARTPSRVLGDDGPNSTEVDMPAHPQDPGEEDPSVVKQWFKEGQDSERQQMIDDSLLDSAGMPELPAAEEEPAEDEAPEPGEEEGDPRAGEEFELPPELAKETDDPRGPNPFDDEDQTIGAEPTRAKARYGEGEAAKRPTAPRPPPARVRSGSKASVVEDPTPGGDEPPEMDELEGANRELQRLLERREGEIASLRAQVKTLEAALKDREEQLQLAKRVLKTNGLG